MYTKASDEAAVLRYLDEAERLNARAVILAAHITPVIHQKLEKMLHGRLIILLSEYHELTNTFYIGSDAKAHDKICIYSPMGLPQFPLAIIKAKLTDKTVCLCNDCYLEHPHHEKNPNTGFVVTCNQDGYEQGMIASKMAIDFVKDGLYPENKKTYIPSHLDVSIKYSDAI